MGGIKTGTDSSGPGGVWRVPAAWPDGVRHEGDVSLVCCSCTERGKAHPETTARGRCEGASQAGGTRKGLSTDAGCAGGPACSSGEPPAWRGGRGAKGPGHRWLVRLVNRAQAREELDGHAEATRKAVCDLQVGGVGGLSAGEGQQGRTGRGRVLARGLREGSEGQPVQDLESDVVGQLPAAAGAGGGDTQTAWRGDQGAWGAHGRRIGPARPVRARLWTRSLSLTPSTLSPVSGSLSSWSAAVRGPRLSSSARGARPDG